MHYVRISVDNGGAGNEYHAALDLATIISRMLPGMRVDVVQDKVWASYCTQEDSSGTQEVPE